jgi:hypothetical protein
VKTAISSLTLALALIVTPAAAESTRFRNPPKGIRPSLHRRPDLRGRREPGPCAQALP